MGILGWLTLLFVTLKLLEIITWSWWLVWAPMYIIPVMVLFTVIGAITVAVNAKG